MATDPPLARRRINSENLTDPMPENPRTPKNWNLITGSMEAPYDASGEVHVIPKYLKQHRITLLKRYVSRDDREEAGSQPTRYITREDYKNISCAATGGGVSAAMQNQQMAEDQLATFFVDIDPKASTEDGVLFAHNLFVIEAVEPNGVYPTQAWEIHAMRKLANPREIELLERSVTVAFDPALEAHYAKGD